MSLPEIGIYWDDSNLWITLAVIVFNPIYWNTVARLNHKSKFVEKLLGSAKRGVVFLAVTIVLLGMFRTYRFKLALASQPANPVLDNEVIYFIGWSFLLIGTLLVLSSLYALGFYGTFLGDYFGIFLPHRVVSFPYNLLGDPMYVGSSFNYFGLALIYQSDAGIFMSLVVTLVYCVTSIYEEEFTRMIYEAFEKRKRKKKHAKS